MRIAIKLMTICLAAVPAFGQGTLASKLLTDPALPIAWGTVAEGRRDAGVKGGIALRVTTTGTETGPDAVGVYLPIAKPVRKGDRLVLAFWARLAKAAEDGTVHYTAIQLAQPPFTPVVQGPARLGTAWEMHQVAGVADRDYAAGLLNVAIQLGGAKRTVDIGPVYALDLGQ